MNKKLIGGIAAGVVVLAVIAALLINGLTGKNTSDVDNTPNDSQQSTSSGLVEQTPVVTVPDVKENMTEENVKESLSKISDNFTFVEEKEETVLAVDGKYRISKYTTYVGKANASDDRVEMELAHRINGAPSISLSIITSSMSEEEVNELARELLTDVTSADVIENIIKAPYDTSVVLDAQTEVEDYSDLVIQKMKMELGDSQTDYIFGATYSVHSEDLKDSYEYNENDVRAFRAVPTFSKSSIPDVLYDGLYASLVHAADGAWVDFNSYRFKTRDNIQESGITFTITMDSGEKVPQSFSIKYDAETDMVYYSATLTTGYYDTMEKVLDTSIKMYTETTGIEVNKENILESEKTDKFAQYIMIDNETGDMFAVDIKYEQSLGYYANIVIY